MKTIFDRLISGGLGGTAQGMFVTLIIGTVAEQLGGMLSGVFGGPFGHMVVLLGQVLTSLTGAGIGIAIARKLEAQHLVTVSAGIVGMIGAQAEGILSGSLFADGGILIAGPGEPLAAFAAVYVAVELGTLIAGKTKLDPILVPLLCIGAGSVVGLFAGPYIGRFSSWLGWLVGWCAGQHPFLMGSDGGFACLPAFYASVRHADDLFCCRPEWSCGRRGCCRMLLQYGWICCGRIQRKRDQRTDRAGIGHVDGPDAEYYTATGNLAP